MLTKSSPTLIFPSTLEARTAALRNAPPCSMLCIPWEPCFRKTRLPNSRCSLIQNPNDTMSGVEVLGIMASVAQITQCAISITSAIAEIYGTVQAAPARVQQGSEQLERLLVTADMIKENRMTQTKSVEAHLAAIVADVNALRVLLSRLATSSKKSFKRYLRVCLGNLEEREMIAQFDKIEKEKTALVLSIIAVHSSFSDATLDTVRPMANKVDNMHQDMRSLTVSSTLYKPNVTYANYHIGNPAAHGPREQGFSKGDIGPTQASGK